MSGNFEVHIAAKMLRMQLQLQLLERAPLGNVAIQLFPVGRHRRVEPFYFRQATAAYQFLRTLLVARRAGQARDPVLGIRLPVPLGDQRRQRAKALLAFAQRGQRLLALGDVAARAVVTMKLSVFVKNWLACDRDPHRRAVAALRLVREPWNRLATFDASEILGIRLRRCLKSRHIGTTFSNQLRA